MKTRIPRKLKKKCKKMGVYPIFKTNLSVTMPVLSEADKDRIVKAFKEYRKQPLILI
jgi:hypothetical protein